MPLRSPCSRSPGWTVTPPTWTGTLIDGMWQYPCAQMVPEVKQNQTVGLTLLHVRFADRLSAAPTRAVLEGYQGRYSALVDAVTETESTFDDEVLATVDVVDLLTEPVNVLADRWRST